MTFISSDTNVWIDFMIIEMLEVPFRLPYRYIMSKDAVDEELLSPPRLGSELVSYGLMPIEITMEEFLLAEKYGSDYIRLSVYDRIALAIAKNRGIVLLTGDKALRKAAHSENLDCIGTLGLIDQLWTQGKITKEEYVICLSRLQKHNGGAVRLPGDEISTRLKSVMEERID